ncbi:MAG: TolC family protein [Phycisphaeraceae bacterium]|nr:TolC family protein [Phycisphaeraceae bacterium]
MTHRTLLVLAASLLAFGCASRPRWPAPEQVAARHAGVADALVTDTAGGEIDSADPPGDELSLERAVGMAMRTHPDIQAALAEVRLAYAEAQQQRLLPNPILTVAVKIPVAGGAPTIEPGIAAELASLLFMPGRIRAADHRLRAASERAVVVVLDVLTEVRHRYVEAQALDALAVVLAERARLTDRLLEIARSRLRAGEGTRLDVTTLEAQKVELEVEAAEQALALREARLELARLIGRPNDPGIWRLDAWIEPETEISDERAWARAGLEQRPEIAAQMWELAALGVEFRQSSWGLLEGAEVGMEAEGTVESGADDWAVGPALTLAVPVLDWGQARRDAASARRLEAAHRLTQARRLVVEEVRRAYAALEMTTRTYHTVTEQWIPLVERRRSEAESQYKAGQSDVVPLILADQDVLAAQAKRIELARQASVALTRLHRAVGGPGAVPIAPGSRPADDSPSPTPLTP